MTSSSRDQDKDRRRELGIESPAVSCVARKPGGRVFGTGSTGHGRAARRGRRPSRSTTLAL
ncbi:MAG: hypothetical protein AVDCRST_MAG19-106 [uncultured Thermomicrobiales bacterium]|uniref:Uncharacterized protein n=1 Tax=uncultured Thermomicrobiales bacterium TaxID=1645740 RepID=A0A6J4UAX1_9BACT|nr:MAG: hypothetical protein AVDCRST_MAG19-106 [uncultured Thermomicrobiales bacterium]